MSFLCLLRAVNESSPVSTGADGTSPTELCPCCCMHQMLQVSCSAGLCPQGNLSMAHSCYAGTQLHHSLDRFLKVVLESVTYLTGISKRCVLCEAENYSKNKTNTKTPNVFKLFCSHHTETQNQGNFNANFLLKSMNNFL